MSLQLHYSNALIENLKEDFQVNQTFIRMMRGVPPAPAFFCLDKDKLPNNGVDSLYMIASWYGTIIFKTLTFNIARTHFVNHLPPLNSRLIHSAYGLETYADWVQFETERSLEIHPGNPKFNHLTLDKGGKPELQPGFISRNGTIYEVPQITGFTYNRHLRKWIHFEVPDSQPLVRSDKALLY